MDKNISFIKNIVYHVIAFFIYLLCNDILLFFWCKINISDINVIHILCINIGISIFLALLFGILKSTIIKCIVLILLLLLNVLYVSEVLLYNTFSNFFSLNDIFHNANNVVANYKSDIFYILSANFVIILSFILIYITLFIVLILINNDNEVKIKHIITSICVGVVFVLLGFLCSDNSLINYNAYLLKNGLKSSLFYNILPEEVSYYIDGNKAIKNIDDKIDDTNMVHKWNIDFDSIDENRKEYIDVNNYIKSLDAAPCNDYTGLFKGKNLILICAEAFSKYIIDEELTPTLYRLYNNGFRFNDFYQPCWYGGTSGGEYSFLTGLVPTDSTCSTLKAVGHNMGLTISNMLKKDGYSTAAFHNGNYTFYDRNITHNETLGFDYYMASGNGLEKMGVHMMTDDIFFDKTFPFYKDKKPFCIYYLTVTGHAFYNNNEDYKVKKYIDRVKNRYGDKYSDQVNNYLCSQLYLEDGLKSLLSLLEENNILDDTVICMVPDHYPYGLTNNPSGNPFTDGTNYVEELYDKKDIDSFERDCNSWILWSGSLENKDKDYVKDINYPTFTLDVLPTLLNLFGLDYDSRLLVGNDVFSDYEHLVFSFNEDFITDEYKYFNSGNKMISKNNDSVDKDKINEVHSIVKNKIYFSKFILDNDYYKYIYDLCKK